MAEPAIAVIGYAYRAPGVGRTGLWDFLAAARSAWSPVPSSRFKQEVFYHKDSNKAGCISSQGAHFLPDAFNVYAFDAAFFNLKADETRAMDPQHRLILECAMEAAESAGVRLDDLAGQRIGVFAANETSDYAFHQLEDVPTTTTYTAIGTSATMFANRLSYFFDLTGPSFAVDAACASSSQALHLACQSIKFGDCDAAFVVGAKVLISPSTWSALDSLGALSAEGKCFSFDTRASGFGRGEGAACVIIQRLDHAIQADRPIRSVIRSTASNHGGRTKGITMPSQAAQEELLNRVHREVHLNPNETAFVEAHGTGTPAGDPIEGSAIASVMASARTESMPVCVGSLKSNIGHLESVSGLLAVIKSTMMIERSLLLPNALFDSFNRNIVGKEKLRVLDTVEPWPEYMPKRVCIANYGFGGSNTAIIIEGLAVDLDGAADPAPASHTDHCRADNPTEDGGPRVESCAEHGFTDRLFVFSAKSHRSLTSYMCSFARYLRNVTSSNKMTDRIAFTLGQRRTHFSYRFAITASSLTSLQARMPSGSFETGHSGSKDAAIGFLFTGQGAQDSAAGGALLELAGKLFTLGVNLEFGKINDTDNRRVEIVTDLPAYEWDRVSLMCMPRMALQKLYHGRPYHHLLGWQSPYNEGCEHSFRNVFTIDELPWIRDHVVAGDTLFPFTGYLVLAIEALNALSTIRPSSIIVHECHIKRALKVVEGERVDLTTRLKPADLGTELHCSVTWSFEILSWSEGHGWKSHCHGMIEPESTSMAMTSQNLLVAATVLSDDKLDERSAQQEYAVINQNGTVYGPAFQTMVRLWQGHGVSVHEVEQRPIPVSGESPVTGDPPTLDAFLHGYGMLLRTGRHRPIYVPTYISRLRISNSIPAITGQIFTTVSRHLHQDEKSGLMQMSNAVFATINGCRTPIFDLDAITLKVIAQPQEETLVDVPECHYWKNALHAHLTDSHELEKLLVDAEFEQDELQHHRDLNKVALHYITRSLKETADHDFSEAPPHLVRFLHWARSLVLPNLVDDHGSYDAAALIERVSSHDAGGKMVCAVGEQLTEVLHGRLEPLEIMLRDGLLWKTYEEDPATIRSSQSCAKYAGILAETDPRMNILEIGAGTGRTTLAVLEAMSRGIEEAPAFLQYSFTDISSGFFETARTKLARWSKQVVYGKLDISEDPREQGFASGAYDLVIAANVLHATADISVTMKNVRSLLRPGGKLLLLEVVRHVPAYLPFALLPGWWLHDDEYRSSDGPLLSEKVWSDILVDNGFSGIEGSAQDYPGALALVMTTMWSTRIEDLEPSVPRSAGPVIVCGQTSNAEVASFAELVSAEIAVRFSLTTVVKPFLELTPNKNEFWIFVDHRQSNFQELSPVSFDNLKVLCLQSAGLLWISPENAGPDGAVIKGLLHSLRQEDTSRKLLLIEDVPLSQQSVPAIIKVAEKMLGHNSAMCRDQDLVWENGLIYVPRLRRLPMAKEILATEAGPPSRELQNIWSCGQSLEMTMDAAGDLDSIYFRRSDAFDDELGDDELIVRTEASGLNFRDLLLVLGSMPWSNPGLEGAGEVVRTGVNVRDLKPGDRVFFIPPRQGSFANFVRIPCLSARAIPEKLSTVDAATMPIAYSTAIQCLLRIARLQRDETVLIHAASGAVGQACIVLAQHLGARVFATAGSPEKRDFLHQEHHIPKTHIFSSRTADFRDGILCATDGRGVDVIVNCLSGKLLKETWSLIAEFGRFVEIAKKDFAQNTYLGMRHFDRNVTFSGLDIRRIFQDPTALDALLSQMTELLQRGVITPIRPVTQMPISQIVAGMRRLQSGSSWGKIVITFGPDECVLAERGSSLKQPGQRLLAPDATYVITGGTGGIGRSIATWMIKKGAHHIVLLGRSGPMNPEVAELLERYEGTDTHLRAISCDVGSRPALVGALDKLQDLPPVRGVVHGALFLRDSFLMNATYDDWQKITAPKINAAWHLHDLLPNLDFFIALSSMQGPIGHVGQSIYAGTSTFLDAFTQHRLRLGLPAVSISLPVVEGVGYVAERGLTETLKGSVGLRLTESQVHTLVEAGIVGPSSGLFRQGKLMAFCMDTGPHAAELPWAGLNFWAALRVDADDAKQQECDLAGDAQVGGTSIDVLSLLIEKVATITMMDHEEVSAGKNLTEYGLDSLVAVELRSFIRRGFGVEMALTQIFGAANLQELADNIQSQM